MHSFCCRGKEDGWVAEGFFWRCRRRGFNLESDVGEEGSGWTNKGVMGRTCIAVEPNF